MITVLEWIIVTAGTIAYTALGIAIYQSTGESDNESNTITRIVMALAPICVIIGFLLLEKWWEWIAPTHQQTLAVSTHSYRIPDYLIHYAVLIIAIIIGLIIGLLTTNMGIRLILKHRARGSDQNEDTVRRYPFTSPFWQRLRSQYGIRGPSGLFRVLFCSVYAVLGIIAIAAMLYFHHAQ